MISSNSLGLLGHHPCTPMGILQNTWPYFRPNNSSHPAAWQFILASQTKPGFTQLAPKYKVWQLASQTQPHKFGLTLLALFAWPHMLLIHNCPHTPGLTILASNSRPPTPGLIKLATHTLDHYIGFKFLAKHTFPPVPRTLGLTLFLSLYGLTLFLSLYGSHSSCLCMASLSCHFMTSHSSCHFMASHFSCRFMETLSSCQLMAPHSSGRSLYGNTLRL